MNIYEFLQQTRAVMDGAMGTYFQTLTKGEKAQSEYALQDNKELIKSIHAQYLEAGANMIKTNTYLLNPYAIKLAQDELDKMQTTACRLVKEAIRESKKTAFAVGDVGPILREAETTKEEILKNYQHQIDLFLKEEMDAILFETFSDAEEIKLLAPYIKEKRPQTFVIGSFCVNQNGYTLSQQSIYKLTEKLKDCEAIDAIGINCGIGSGHMKQLLNNLVLPENKYFFIAPNAGYPEQVYRRMIFQNNIDFFEKSIKEMVTKGAAIIGSCCGTTPEYTKRIAQVIHGLEPVRLTEKVQEQKSGKITRIVRKNQFLEKLEQGKMPIAVELDPPYEADDTEFMGCVRRISSLPADLITIADSPRGRSRIDSLLMSTKLKHNGSIDVMPHLCCRDRNMVAMRSSILGAYVNDIRNFLFVTGDPLPVQNRSGANGVFDYNSIRLMEFVKTMNEESFAEDPIIYGGALNYAGANVDAIIKRMKQKMEAGVSYFLTQPIYSDADIKRVGYLREQTGAKIMAGIMPFVSIRNAVFMKNEFAGINVPMEIVERYSPEMTKEEAEEVGAALAMELIEKLEPYCDGYYFMLPFNRVSMFEKITRLRGGKDEASN